MMHKTSFLVTLNMATILFSACAFAVLQQPLQPSNAFRNWDKNGDGKLTRDELPEPLRQNFDRVDTNHDGFITPDEDEAFRSRAPKTMPRPPRVPDSILAKSDIPYAGTDNPRQKLDLYLPKSPRSDKPLPVIVWIHGGAWLAGDKSSGIGQLSRFVGSGDYAGVSVAYRLTNEATWPAQIHDCKAAIRWIRGNAKEYNLDPERIGVWGSSAGGHLVAMLGTSGGVEALEGQLGEFTDKSSRVTCVVDFFGPSDLLAIGDYPSTIRHNAPDSPESRLVGGPLLEMKDAAASASPTTYVSADDPPFLIVHGDKDLTVPLNQSVRLNELLQKTGVDVTFMTIEGGGHGGFASDELNRRVRDFFEKHLRGKQVDVAGGTVTRRGGRCDVALHSLRHSFDWSFVLRHSGQRWSLV